VRIIAGQARGRVLAAPKGMDTRPTQGKVRESLFNILRPWLHQARVLDLFAGSGALALAALSQGAQSAVMVDSDRSAQAAIEKNIAVVGVKGQAELFRCDWKMALKKLEGRRFDLIFLDPPYRMENLSQPLAEAAAFLEEDGLVVFEHLKNLPPQTPAGLEMTRQKDYGDTVISFYQRETGSQEE